MKRANTQIEFYRKSINLLVMNDSAAWYCVYLLVPITIVIIFFKLIASFFAKSDYDNYFPLHQNTY